MVFFQAISLTSSLPGRMDTVAVALISGISTWVSEMKIEREKFSIPVVSPSSKMVMLVHARSPATPDARSVTILTAPS